MNSVSFHRHLPYRRRSDPWFYSAELADVQQLKREDEEFARLHRQPWILITYHKKKIRIISIKFLYKSKTYAEPGDTELYLQRERNDHDFPKQFVNLYMLFTRFNQIFYINELWGNVYI